MQTVALLSIAGAASLALWRPATAVAAWFAIVSWTSALPWHLTGQNVPWTLWILGGISLGLGARAVLGDRPAPTASLPLLLLLLITNAAAAALAWIPGEIVLLEVGRALSDALTVWNPAGVAGFLQAAAVAISGPMVAFGVATVCTSEWAGGIKWSLRLGTAGLALSPGLAWLTSNSLSARPDRGELAGVGWTGLCQDPHAFAAAVLLTTLPLAVMVARSRRQLVLAMGAGAIPLIGSLSEVGVLAATLAASLSLPRPPALRTRLRLVGAAAAGLLVLSLLASTGRLPDGSALGLDGHLARLTTTSSLRTAAWSRAMAAVRRQPAIGVGPGQLAEMDLEHWSPSTLPASLLDAHVERENAHNNYLQYAAEHGLAPAILFAALVVGVGLRRPAAEGPQRLGSAAAAAVTAVGALSLGAHPLLLAELQGSFWIWVGLWLASANRPALRIPRVFAIVAVVVSGALLLRPLPWRHYYSGFWPAEVAEQPVTEYRWSQKRRASVWVADQGPRLVIRLFDGARPSDTDLTILLNGRQAAATILSGEGWRTLEIPTFPFDSTRSAGRLHVEFVPAKVFVPAEEFGSLDRRRLGVAVGDVAVTDPGPYRSVGAHDPERAPSGEQFQWTRRASAFKIDAVPDPLRVQLRTDEPPQAREATEVFLYWNSVFLRAVEVEAGGWRAFDLEGPWTAGERGWLSLWVNRTWMPAAWSGDDRRQLGVAVALPLGRPETTR